MESIPSSSSQKRDQTDSALVEYDSNDAHSPPKVQKVSASQISKTGQPDQKPDETVVSDTTDVSKTPMTRKSDDHDTNQWGFPRRSGNLTELVHCTSIQTWHKFWEHSKIYLMAPQLHLMHQVECILEEPEKELLGGSSSTSPGATRDIPTNYDLIISTADEEGTSVDPQDHIPRDRSTAWP